jgi:nucleotide-binding universal stress UspA family protein
LFFLYVEALDLLDLTRAQVVKHILIPLDGSALAEDILEPAIALGTLLHAECTLLQAIAPVLAGYAADALAISLDEPSLAHWQTAARAYLERVAEQVCAQGLPVRTSVVVGPAAEAILAYGRQHGVHLIAMATHGRTGLARLLLGSVAEDVVRHARAPVLLHRSYDAAPQHDR